MIPVKKDLNILQGKTYSLPIKWETEPLVYKAISGITQAAPAVVSCTDHGVPDGWRVAVVSAKGMTQINAQSTPPKDSDYLVATYINTNTVELNAVNASGFKAYTSGGYLQYRTPKDLTGFTARMSVKDKVGGTELIRLTTENSRIIIDTATSTIELLLDEATTALIEWTKGVYDLELVSASGVVTALLYGAVTVTKEVTT